MRPAVGAVLVIAMAIAAIAPFDVAFTAVTSGLLIPRVLLIAGLVLIGTFCAERVGLRLEGHGTRSPVLIGIAAAIAVAVYVAVVDGFLYRSTLPAAYVQLFASTNVRERLMYFMLRAF